MTINQTRYPRKWRWPKGAKIAVSLNTALEGFVNRCQYTQEKTGGKKDHFSLSYADYAFKSGVWRILDMLDELKISASVSTNGLAAEQHPEIVKTLVREGHEIVAHGWANDEVTRENESEAELKEIQRVTSILTDVAGVRPTGWVGAGSARSADTLRLLAGEGYVWNGDDASDDLPFVIETGNGRLVMMPKVNIAHNDLVMFVIGRSSPNIIWESFKDTFDLLYHEGQRGSPKWTELTLHFHIGGRPTYLPVFRRCLEYARQHDDVWFPRRSEIAAWALAQDAGAE